MKRKLNLKKLYNTALISLTVAGAGFAKAAYALPDASGITNPLGNIYDLIRILGGCIGAAVIAYAGVNFITSSDDPQRRDDSKNIIKNTLFGLAIVLAAPTMVQFILAV